MATKQDALTAAVSYDVDFYRWTQQTADLINQRRFHEVDLEHVAAEIADMGKRDLRELRSRVIVLLMHLLKWQAQPEFRNRSLWRSTIAEQRSQIQLLLRDSPSLGRTLQAEVDPLYADAVRGAASETHLNRDRFPPTCPYTRDQILDMDFFPDALFR